MAPIVFCDLFKESDDEEEEEKECKGEDCTSSDASKVSSFKQIFEVEKLRILDENFLIRQFSWHRANANQIWPGTFLLAEYLRDNVASYQNGPILELGAATGALSVYLRCPPRSFDVITSDIDDGGDVENNIAYNFELNGRICNAFFYLLSFMIFFLQGMKPPLHIPFTWGTPWNEAVGRVRNRILKNHKSLEQSLEISAALAMRFKYIIASDILLYVR
jgi:hypothetical protein